MGKKATKGSKKSNQIKSNQNKEKSAKFCHGFLSGKEKAIVSPFEEEYSVFTFVLWENESILYFLIFIICEDKRVLYFSLQFVARVDEHSGKRHVL